MIKFHTLSCEVTLIKLLLSNGGQNCIIQAFDCEITNLQKF